MSTPQADAAAQLLYPPNVQFNAGRVYTIKFLAACFAGAVAGILGFENWLGFALFLSSTALTSSCLYIKCKGRPAKYMPGGLWELVNPGQENLFSFLLVWTLFYGAYASAANDVTLTESRALKPGIVHGMSLFCDLYATLRVLTRSHAAHSVRLARRGTAHRPVTTPFYAFQTCSV